MDIRRIWLVVTILLLAVSTNAQFSPKLDSLRTYVTDRAELPFAGTTAQDTAKIIRQIVISTYKVCTSAPAYEKTATVTVDSASEGGALPGDYFAMKQAFLLLGDTLWLPLTDMNADSLFLNRPTMLQNLMDLADLFSIRFYRVHAETLFLHPKWYRHDTAQVFIEYYAIDTTHMIHGDSAIKVRSQFILPIIYHAVSELWDARANSFQAEKWMVKYEKEIAGKND